MQKFIKINDLGIPDLLVETNDPSLVLPDPNGVYIDVTDAPKLQDINKLIKDYTINLVKDADGNITDLNFKVNKEEPKVEEPKKDTKPLEENIPEPATVKEEKPKEKVVEEAVEEVALKPE